MEILLIQIEKQLKVQDKITSQLWEYVSETLDGVEPDEAYQRIEK